ncbi:MAG: exopolyphosphatase, partial [Terriglobales bacterium]
VLRRFHRATRRYGASVVRVVATSAVREAANAAVFAHWVGAATGWRVQVISGLEEGNLIHLGVMSQARLRARRLLLVDLGGGSCEFTISIDRHVRQMYSLGLGAVRLTQEFLPRDPPRKRDLERLRGYIAGELERVLPALRGAQVQLTLGTSGTAAALAAMQQGRTGRSGSVVTTNALRGLFRLLVGRSRGARARMPGVGTHRAEIIVAGAAVFLELLERGGLRGFRFLPLGLRDGILAQMAAERHLGGERRLEAERWEAILAAARRYGVNLAHAQRVRGFAVELFRRLRTRHRMPPAVLPCLEAAAMLYEAGNYVSHTGSRRHAHYLIAQSDIFGFSPQQRRLAAAIVRFQGRALPAPGHAALRALPREEQAALPAAILILRLARGLDQGRQGAVAGVAVSLRPGEARLRLEMRRGGGELETWALEKERPAFRQVFGRALRVSASRRRRPEGVRPARGRA